MESHRISSVPPSILYFPGFISEEEERHILEKIPPNRWISLAHRRLQSLPARLTNSNTLVTSNPLPDWLKSPIVERTHKLEIFSDAPHGINHCLVNEYNPGQGIMPHEDGAAYYPAVATVSLGGTLVLDVTEKGQHENKKSWRILQEPRSLLITTGEAYTETLHGIAEVEEDRDLNSETVANWDLLGDKTRIEENGGVNVRTTRISLTYRDVKKVSALGNKIFGKPKT
ncbi:Alpha-ketoglutarate-dependent dioxygenase alkB-like 6 [Pseudocercospora fuligena]|uniref:Alpha-ketoglutarate-dependent dioxygenase alkB-like 6 n=1 Tax=Pseudocercospora fuligena TaxID=685502 RepID=A0A8H6RTI8_9PEZI|nr:Alpha-ketoglutarate-dependent dioxygenase alkB-like 6 [Pseudocercospora fuligena]